MNILFQDIGLLPYRPHFKCGAAAGIISGAGAALGGIGSIVGAASSSNNASSQLQQQREENQLNRDWQTAEAEKARQYNTSERLATQDYQQTLINQQNEYNSPSHQAAMYQDAGLNPSIALGKGGAIVSANPSTSSPGSSPMPSGVSGLSPVGFQPLDLQIPQLLNGIGGFMKNLGEADKLGVDTDYAKASFNMNLRKLSADASLQEFYAAGEQLTQAIRYGIKDKLVSKALAECEKAHWDALLSEQQGISEKVRQNVLKSQEALNDAVARYNGENAALLRLDVLHYEEAFNQRMAIGRSQINANNASAEQSRASASNLNMDTGLKAFDLLIKSNEKDISDATKQERINQIRSDCSVSQLQAIQEQLRTQDLGAYNAFQRIIFGKTEKGDYNKVFGAFKSIPRNVLLNAVK